MDAHVFRSQTMSWILRQGLAVCYIIRLGPRLKRRKANGVTSRSRTFLLSTHAPLAGHGCASCCNRPDCGCGEPLSHELFAARPPPSCAAASSCKPLLPLLARLRRCISRLHTTARLLRASQVTARPYGASCYSCSPPVKARFVSSGAGGATGFYRSHIDLSGADLRLDP